jgi:hypothetical protein
MPCVDRTILLFESRWRIFAKKLLETVIDSDISLALTVRPASCDKKSTQRTA